MKLVSVKIEHFRNILDSGEVAIERDVTCLVGKNESGKTSFLQALRRLNPDDEKAFDIHEHYPAWLEKLHRLEGKDLENSCPTAAIFALDDAETEELNTIAGKDTVDTNAIVYRRRYNGEAEFILAFNEPAWIRHFCSTIDTQLADELKKTTTAADLHEKLEQIAKGDPNEEESPHRQHAEQAQARLLRDCGTGLDPQKATKEWLLPKIPHFLYFDNISGLPGIIDIQKVAKTKYHQLTDGERTAKALLEIANVDTAMAMSGDYQRRKRELENTANALSKEILDYWSQNRQIRVEIDFNQRSRGTPPESIVHELHIRLYDAAHMLSLPFDERSSGFRWFFSFLCAFSRYRYTREPVIILLDEPALGLHAKAQGDFLRFIDERLAPTYQVIYTTHSPFMVPPDRLNRVRLVEDKGNQEGAHISQDVLSTDQDTLFPLQGALGYDLAQNLFVSAHNLVVEGPSDLVYLQIISSQLLLKNRIGLDPQWTIIPVGGADMLATFAALLSTHLDVTILLDSQPKGNQRLANIVRSGVLKGSRVIEIGEILAINEADIEDLFETEDYLELYNQACSTKLTSEALIGSGTIVKKIARHLNKPRFDHYVPAQTLLRGQTNLLERLSEKTLGNFERLFKRINETLSS